MNERQIQILLMQEYLNRNHKAAIPNSNMLLLDEADLITVTRSGLVHEFEIKISVSDYNREFKNKARKHNRLSGKALTWGRYYTQRSPNYFWFVTHGFEIEPPHYAGWISVEKYSHFSNSQRLVWKKQAPRLHKDKWDDTQVANIARLLSFRLLKEYKNEQDTG